MAPARSTPPVRSCQAEPWGPGCPSICPRWGRCGVEGCVQLCPAGRAHAPASSSLPGLRRTLPVAGAAVWPSQTRLGLRAPMPRPAQPRHGEVGTAPSSGSRLHPGSDKVAGHPKEGPSKPFLQTAEQGPVGGPRSAAAAEGCPWRWPSLGQGCGTGTRAAEVTPSCAVWPPYPTWHQGGHLPPPGLLGHQGGPLSPEVPLPWPEPRARARRRPAGESEAPRRVRQRKASS